MGIPAELVKQLREKTGVGFMECKSALEEAKGDLETAIDYLRKKGAASAACHRNCRHASQLIAVGKPRRG